MTFSPAKILAREGVMLMSMMTEVKKSSFLKDVLVCSLGAKYLPVVCVLSAR